MSGVNVSRKVRRRRRPTRLVLMRKPNGMQLRRVSVVPASDEQQLDAECRALLGPDAEQRAREPRPDEEGSIQAP